MLKRAHLVALSCVGMLLVVGASCAGQPPEPKVSRPSKAASKAATPSASPTPTAPALPAAAKERTDDGVKAFVRYYFDMLNYARRDKNSGPFRALSAPGCKGCAALTSTSLGRYTKGGDWIVDDVQVPADKDPTSAAATVGGRGAPGIWVPSTPNARPTPTKGERWILDMRVVLDSGAWRVEEITAVN